MNEFMMLLWLADVVDRLGGVAALSFFMLVVYCLFAGLVVGHNQVPADKAFSIGCKGAMFVGVLVLLAFIAPSKQTIYIAAAGSATKTAMQTQTGQKLIKAFDKKVDEYLKDEKNDL